MSKESGLPQRQSSERDHYCYIPQDTRRLPFHSSDMVPNQFYSSGSAECQTSSTSSQHPNKTVVSLRDQSCSQPPEFSPSRHHQYVSGPPPPTYSNPPPVCCNSSPTFSNTPPHFSNVPPRFSNPPPSFCNIPSSFSNVTPNILRSSNIPNQPSEVSYSPSGSALPCSFHNPPLTTRSDPVNFPRSFPPPQPPPPVTYSVSNIPVSYENQGSLSCQPSASSNFTTEFISPPWHQKPPPFQASYHQSEPQTSGGHVYGSQSSVELIATKDKFSSGIGEDDVQEDDQKWLEAFEKRIKVRQSPQPKNVMSGKRTVKLQDVEKMILESQKQAEELCQVEEYMKQVSNTAQDQEWQQLVLYTEQVKMKLGDVLKNFQDEFFLQDVKQLVHQRRNKRNRVKRRRKEKQLEKERQKKARQEEEEKIDSWREKLEQEADEKRREKNLTMEADSILGEVRQKQHDTLRMQQLLESLITLRLTRLNKGDAHGYISTPHSDLHFSSTIKGIRDLVNSQMEEYKLEEQTVCVMMESSSSHTVAAREQRVIAKREDAIKKFFFGDNSPLDDAKMKAFTAGDHSLEVLIQRRQDWDQFITDNNNPLASSVPLHWVVPPRHPTQAWAEFQIE